MTRISVRLDLATAVRDACRFTGVRPPNSIEGSILDGGKVVDLVWNPDLSPADQATVAGLVKLAVGATLLTKAERDALEPTFAILRQYRQASSPTAAQTVTAVQGIIDVLRAFVRD